MARNDYAQTLLAAMAAKKLSKRALGTLMAEELGTEPESERRAIYRYVTTDEEKRQLPEPKKAEVIGRLLEEPSLSDVPGRAKHRRDRLRELEERVEAREQQGDVFAQEVLARLAALEATQGLGAQQPSQQETERQG